MEVITTHLNADFDALASMMAAKKLHPGARMVFPGSQEKLVRDFLAGPPLVELSFDRLKEIDLDQVTRLILVDVRVKGRLGPFDAVAARPGVELVIYDHHPATDRDYRGKTEVVAEVGSTSTLMAELLRRRRAPLTPGDATLLALGIYEDTGSLTFASTTVRDLAAAAWLLARGARLPLISGFLSRELSAEQVAILDQLLQSLAVHDVAGVQVGVAMASSGEYVADVAQVVHKLLDIKRLPVFFALVRLDDRLTLIARSRVPEVSAARVAEEFGGGGHSTAASATIRDLTSTQAQERLLAALRAMAGEGRSARDLMSSPVIAVPPGETLARARETMSRLGINSLPVTDPAGRPVGIITRGVAERAARHGLGEAPVSEYMLTDFATVAEDAPLTRVEEAIVERRQRLLPVLAPDGTVRGVISRTDMLVSMHEDLSSARRGREAGERGEEREGAETKPGRVKNLREVMREVLPAETLALLERAGGVAERMGVRVYIVGGFVRDLLLRNPNLDLDLVAEGDGIVFARRLARALRAHIRTHRKFGTAKLVLPDRRRLDVATARTEYYESPGAPPTVEEGSIKLDLYRRDFSINALAIRLNPADFGKVVDFFGGQRDLKERTIRVLHNLSFVEDPTRILRAVRFEQRFGFRIARFTQDLLKGAVARGYLPRAQGFRVFGELAALLREEKPGPGLARLEELGVLTAIHPALGYGPREAQVLARAEKVVSWYNLLYLPEPVDPARVYFSSLMLARSPGEREGAVGALFLPRQQAQRWLSRWNAMAVTAQLFAAGRRTGRLTASSGARHLSGHPTDELLALMATTRSTETARFISRYITHLRGVRRETDGKALLAMGYPPGPLFGEILTAVQDARWDGEVRSLEEEGRWIRGKFPANEKRQ
jgi:tRNA nucleotidyltransferase (CCA-adding enzyme)